MGENLLISQCSVHPRVSSSATASPVAGARAMPSPPWPVHWQKPGHGLHKADGTVAVGRARADARVGAHYLELAEARDELAGRLHQQLYDLGDDAVVKAGVHLARAVDYARAGAGLFDREAEVVLYRAGREELGVLDYGLYWALLIVVLQKCFVGSVMANSPLIGWIGPFTPAILHTVSDQTPVQFITVPA